MKYKDGRDVQIGDKVKLGDDPDGTVIVLIAENEYLPPHSAEQWSYLKRGAMFDFPRHGLIHYEDKIEDDVELVRRASIRSKPSE
jgi:hypothetical protein